MYYIARTIPILSDIENGQVDLSVINHLVMFEGIQNTTGRLKKRCDMENVRKKGTLYSVQI